MPAIKNFIGLTLLLLAPLCVAVHQGYKPTSAAEVPYATGFVMKINEEEQQYTDCLVPPDDMVTSFCSGGLVSEGVFVTAAHCFPPDQMQTLEVAQLRVGLGNMVQYRNDDGSCSGQVRGTSEGIYKVKAVFIHKQFTPIVQDFDYSNAKTGKTATGQLAYDHMDVAVVFLDECTSPVPGSNKPRYGSIAGGKFSEWELMWKNFDSIGNTGGLPVTMWGYGESQDDTVSSPLKPKGVRRGNMNLIRATTPPTVSTGSQRKVGPNCDWLPDSTAVWDVSADQVSAAHASGGIMKATPYHACSATNPNDESVKSRCEDQTTSGTCTTRKSDSGKSFCKWADGTCEIDENVAGGIGLVTYPSAGGGDSGAALWYIENSDKLTLHDRDQLNLVHIGVSCAGSTFFPAWDLTCRSDYFQNWLATIIDRDTCATKPTREYFKGFDESVAGGSSSGSVTQSGWDLDNNYMGIVKGVSGTKGLSQLSKRANAGDWTVAAATAAPTTAAASTAAPTTAAATTAALATVTITVTPGSTVATTTGTTSGATTDDTTTGSPSGATTGAATTGTTSGATAPKEGEGEGDEKEEDPPEEEEEPEDEEEPEEDAATTPPTATADGATTAATTTTIATLLLSYLNPF